MSKGQWHINDKGVTGKCTADKVECRFGKHFETQKIAEAVAGDRLDRELGTFAVVKKDTGESVAQGLVPNVEKAFAHNNGEKLEDKYDVLDELQADKLKLEGFLEKQNDNILWDTTMTVPERRKAVKSLAAQTKVLKMTEDAIAILSNDEDAKLLKGVDVDSYDNRGNRIDLKAQKELDREAIEKQFKALKDHNQWSSPEQRDGAEDTFVDDVMKNPRKLQKAREWSKVHDDEGNYIYRGADVVDDEVAYGGVNYVRLTDNVGADVPDGFRIQLDRELTPDEANHLAQNVGYAYSMTGGERGVGFDQDTPNSIVVGADTTKGRAYQKMDEFVANLRTFIKEGSPKRKTDRSGSGTKGTRLVQGLGEDLKIEIYADSVYGDDN